MRRKKAIKKNALNRVFPRVKIPKPAEQFSITTMPALPYRLYKRISEIYGIPLKELLPTRGKDYFFGPAGFYDERKHEIRFRSFRLSKNAYGEMVVEEELLHSLQNLLYNAFRIKFRKMLEKKLNKQKADEKYRARVSPAEEIFESIVGIEPSAKVRRSKAFHLVDSLGYFIPLIFWIPLKPWKKQLPALFPSSTYGLIARLKVKKFYERYGPDGLLLLYIDPPKNFNLLKLDEKERFFIENNLLTEKGLTKKGVRYIKERLPREIILEALRALRGSKNI